MKNNLKLIIGYVLLLILVLCGFYLCEHKLAGDIITTQTISTHVETHRINGWFHTILWVIYFVVLTFGAFNVEKLSCKKQ